jgi:hypothetical protein
MFKGHLPLRVVIESINKHSSSSSSLNNNNNNNNKKDYGKEGGGELFFELLHAILFVKIICPFY